MSNQLLQIILNSFCNNTSIRVLQPRRLPADTSASHPSHSKPGFTAQCWSQSITHPLANHNPQGHTWPHMLHWGASSSQGCHKMSSIDLGLDAVNVGCFPPTQHISLPFVLQQGCFPCPATHTNMHSHVQGITFSINAARAIDMRVPSNSQKM